LIRQVIYYGETLTKVADRDLTISVRTLGDRDTIGNALTSMVTELNEVLGEIRSSSEQVTTGATQISSGAQNLAQGATEQAAAVQQLSSSINEVAEKTQENARLASKAADLSGTIRGNAHRGAEQMDQMMQAMREINEASNKINDVVKVIDNIAFQTNILALNAAVEAARAGQHGKSFTVVAEEVRALAAKSTDAAKETGVMIENSIEKAALGIRIADETSASLSEIVSGINESTEIITEIAQSSGEQSVSIKQINIGVDQVAQVVQQNSATAEESAAAAEEMSSQSSIMNELVSRFKTSGSLPASQKRSALPRPSDIYSPHSHETSRPASGFDDDNFGKY
jgi:methyl-accepting chemotaxis protein